MAARGGPGVQGDAEAVDDARLRQTVGSANGIAMVAGTQEEAAISLRSTRSAGNREVSRSWADAEDSGSDGNNSSAGCDFHALHGNVEAQVTCKAPEVDENEAVAKAISGKHKRKGRRSKATKGAIITSGVDPTSRVSESEAEMDARIAQRASDMIALRAKWLEERGGLEADDLDAVGDETQGSGGCRCLL